jgi:hypothetical protein
MLENPFGSAAEQQTSETSLAMRADYYQIDFHRFGHAHYLFVGTPNTQDRLGLYLAQGFDP